MAYHIRGGLCAVVAGLDWGHAHRHLNPRAQTGTRLRIAHPSPVRWRSPVHKPIAPPFLFLVDFVSPPRILVPDVFLQPISDTLLGHLVLAGQPLRSLGRKGWCLLRSRAQRGQRRDWWGSTRRFQVRSLLRGEPGDTGCSEL